MQHWEHGWPTCFPLAAQRNHRRPRRLLLLHRCGLRRRSLWRHSGRCCYLRHSHVRDRLRRWCNGSGCQRIVGRACRLLTPAHGRIQGPRSASTAHQDRHDRPLSASTTA